MEASIHTPPSRLAANGVLLERNGRVFARLPDLDLGAGRAVALTGPSGTGKTTALLALAGIRPPREGRILVEGADLWSLPAARRDRLRGRRIGLVFQNFHLIDAVSVEENLRLAASCAGLGIDSARVGNLLDSLGIGSISRQRADRISQGQAQRVAVARALINRPALVLADEPTSSLDDDNARALLGLLAKAARGQGAALLVATHDRRVLETVDEIVAMETVR